MKDGGPGIISSAQTPKGHALREDRMMTNSDGKDFDRLTEIIDINHVKPGDHTFGK